MKVTHIYVYGDIINFQGSDLSEDEFSSSGFVSLTTVKNQFNQNPDCEEIVVHIHSIGGDVFEGFAIHDFLISTGKKVTTLVEGLCASIATVIFLAGSSRLLTENSRFLIHNPWTFTEGSADELEEVAAALRKEQQRMLDFYVEKTGSKAEALQSLMNEDKVIDADSALTLGFATEILDAVKSMARSVNAESRQLIFNSIKSKTTKMKIDKKTKLTGLVASSKALLNKLSAALTGEDEGAVEASSIELEGGDSLFCAEDELAVGVAVFSDAELTTPAPDNTYIASSGDTIVVAGGLVESITPKAEASAETDAQIIARLTSERDAAVALANDNEVLATGLGTQLETLQASATAFMTKYKPEARTTVTNTIKAKKVVGSNAQSRTETDASLKDEVAEFKAKRAEAAAKK